MADHPGGEELEALASGQVAEPERARLEAHLSGCGPCRRQLAGARADERLFAELRGRLGRRPGAGPASSPPGYELLEERHRGGQGVVHRGLQLATGRSVAVKLLSGGRLASFRERRRFEREIDLASRLQHPGIVAILDSGLADGVPYLVMDFVDGRPLDAHVAAARPDLAARLRLFSAIAEAVAHAHLHGVIHRDLKPANILVDGSGAPHVLDYGIATAAELRLRDAARVTGAGEFMGTLAYASPEQVLGDPARIDARTDVYSLGVVLYELLTGRLPYDVSSAVSAAVESITRQPPRDPRRFARHVDAELASIVLAALEKDPARRYPTVDALARDVAHYLAGEPLEVRGRSVGYVLRKGLRRHRVAVAVAAALLATVGGAAWVVVSEHLDAREQGERAALVREVFQEVLAAARPERMGADVRLLEVLQLASQRIDSELADAPDVQAAIQLTIGDTYRRLFLLPEAERHLRQALERFRCVDDDRRLRVAECLALLGTVLAQRGSPEAVEVQEEALKLRANALEPGHPLLAASRRDLGLALQSQLPPEPGRAEEHLQAALADFRARLGPDHPDVAEIELRLLWTREASDAELEAGCRRALEVFGRHPGEEPRLIETLNGFSCLLREWGRLDEAEEVLKRSIALSDRLYGAERSAEMLARYAELQVERGDMETAESLFARSLVEELEQWARRRPADGPRLHALAARLRRADPALGEPPYAQAFAELRSFHGDGSFELASQMNDLARVLRGRGRCAAAEDVLEQALRIHCRAYGADCPVRVDSLSLTADCLAASGQNEAAAVRLREALAVCERRGQGASSTACALRERLAATGAPLLSGALTAEEGPE